MLKLGDKTISKLYLGDRPILKAYLGDKLVFQAGKTTFLESVIFDGKSYIDTLYKPKSSTSVKIKYRPYYNAVFSCVFGTQDDATTNRMYLVLSSTLYRVQFCSGNLGTFFGISADGLTSGTNGTFTSKEQEATITIDNHNKKVSIESEELTNSYDMATYNTGLGYVNCNYSLFLGDRNSGGSPSTNNGFKGEIYGFEIYEKDILVHNFRPCIHPNGTVCFYDMITKKYFYNQGTGTLTAGNKINFVDYIESNGGAYIDTELKPSYDYTVKIKYQYTDLSVTFNPIFGMRTSAVGTGNNLFWAGMHYVDKQAYLRFGENSVNYALGDKALDVLEMTCSPEGILINGEDTGARYFNGEITPEAESVYLFTINNSGQPNGGLGDTNAKVYSYQVFDGDMNLIQDLKPCVSNGVAGFYDMVTGKMFTNAGTGTLKASGKFVKSILFDGACVVDTGITHQTCTIECDIRFEETGTRQLMGFGTGSGQYWGAGSTGIFDYMSGTNALDRTEVVIDFDAEQINYTIYADGKSRTSVNGNALSSLTYRIGAGPTGKESNSYWCTCEVWGNKITNADGVIIQDLRPYVDENGVACFKDVVTGNLFYNLGTGTLTYKE